MEFIVGGAVILALACVGVGAAIHRWGGTAQLKALGTAIQPAASADAHAIASKVSTVFDEAKAAAVAEIHKLKGGTPAPVSAPAPAETKPPAA